MSRSTLGSVLGALMAFAAVPASAQEGGDGASARINYTTYGDDQLSSAFDAQVALDQPDWCRVMVPLTRQMVTRGSFSSRLDALEAYSNLMCSAGEKRWTDAYMWMIALERRSGKPSAFPMGVWVSHLAERYDAAEERLFAYIDADDRMMLTDGDSKVVWDLAQAYVKAKERERSLALFRALIRPERLAKFPAADRDIIGSELFQIEVETGNTTAAATNLAYLKSPYAFKSALGDRRYAKLWPQIEAKAGRNMVHVIDAQVDRSKADFEAAPDNMALMKDLANAYLIAGRFDDVVALVGAHEPARDAYADMLTEDMGWALNVKVYALDALDRSAEAEMIFDDIAALDLDGRSRGWLVNFVINRALRFVDLGQGEKGLAAASLAKEVAAETGNEFARMLVRRATLCALQAKGRTDEMPPLVAEVIEHQAEAPAEAAAALLCANADDEAARIARAALEDPTRAGAMINALQSREFELFYNDSVTPGMFDRIRKRPDVAPLFDKHARDIPRDFAPPFTERRSALRAARDAAE